LDRVGLTFEQIFWCFSILSAAKLRPHDAHLTRSISSCGCSVPKSALVGNSGPPGGCGAPPLSSSTSSGPSSSSSSSSTFFDGGGALVALGLGLAAGLVAAGGAFFGAVFADERLFAIGTDFFDFASTSHGNLFLHTIGPRPLIAVVVVVVVVAVAAAADDFLIACVRYFRACPTGKRKRKGSFFFARSRLLSPVLQQSKTKDDDNRPFRRCVGVVAFQGAGQV
jgi:hypothetical protein